MNIVVGDSEMNPEDIRRDGEPVHVSHANKHPHPFSPSDSDLPQPIILPLTPRPCTPMYDT